MMGLEFGDAVMLVLRWVCALAFVVALVVSVAVAGRRLRNQATDPKWSLFAESRRQQDAENGEAGHREQRPDRVQPVSPHHS